MKKKRKFNIAIVGLGNIGLNLYRYLINNKKSIVQKNNVNKELDHDLLYFVNDDSTEAIFLSILSSIKGLNPIKCGTLDLSILIESQVPLLLNINKAYRKSTSINIKGL